MLLIRLLNACHHLPGFVCAAARICTATKTIEVDVRARAHAKPSCSVCHKPASGYDQLPQCRFEFIPVWGLAVFSLYGMRRVARPPRVVSKWRKCRGPMANIS